VTGGAEADHDFTVLTDGAGHQDGYGGAGVVCMSQRFDAFFFRVLACNGTNTDRMELTALLEGLQGIMDELGADGEGGRQRLLARRPTVLWVCDREAMVKSATGEYGRKTNLDLWARYDWYARYLDVRPEWHKRNTIPWQAVSDRMASEARLAMKEYCEMLREQRIVA